MKIKDLKIAIEQYDDNDLIFIRVGIGTSYRIDKCQIPTMKDNNDLLKILKASKDEQTNSLVFELE